MRRARCADAGLVGAAVAAILLAASPARGEKSGVRPNVISVPSGPGTISGLGEQFEPTLNTGSATYAVNLDVPPGTAGLAPGLALHYDSGQGDGIVGIGWSFDVGAIQRQTDHGVPRYGATDRFLWNGQELVPVAPGVFRLKIEGAFLRFRQAADHWEADARDGTTYRFGVSSSARVSGPDGGVFRWALEQVVDVSGNKIAFSYEADSAQIYPTRIDYNARTGAAQNSVRFEYESRKDAITDYRAGFGITTARRLKRVRMMVGEARVRRYELAYLPDTPASVLSRLGSVTMFGTDDTTALPTLSFGYSDFDPAKSQVQGLSNPPAFSLRDANTELDDFDGDGLPDLVHTELGHHVVALNQGDGWGTPTTLAASPSVQLAATGTELGDLDGDGIPDLIAKLAPGAGDFVYFPNRGAGKWEDAVRFQNNPAFSFEDPGVRMLDFDGDGLVDAMQTTPTQYYYWRNNGDGTWSAPISGSPIADQAVLFSDAQVRLVDMNGDRLLDLVYVTSGSLTYWPSLGWGHWGTAVRVSGAPDAGADQPKVQLADVNGDGLSDAVLASGTEARMWLQRGDGSFAAPVAFTGVPEANPATTVVRLGDINGTGTIDLIWNAPDAAAARVWRYLDLTGGVRPNLLTTIANGLGRTIEIAYSSSGAMYRMAAAAGMPWSVRLPIPTQVVASVTTSDGRGWSKQEAFVYRDGYFDGPTRQFRGFGQATRMEPGNDEEATSVQVHRFDVGATDEALRGVELGFEVQTATGSVLARESFGYDVHLFELGTDGRRVAGPDRRWHVVDHVEGTATPRSTREEWTYDDFGDVLVHSEWGVIDGTNLLAENDERITTTEYASDTDRWLLGRPTHATVTNAAGARLSETFTYYDGDPFVGLPFGRLGSRGLPTRTEAWVEGDRLVQTTRLQRDEFGLVTAMLDPRGSRREVDYDVATHCFPIAERSLLEGGRKLELTAGYDPTTGTLSWYKDAAGRQTSFHYNPLLQLSSIVRAGDSDAKPTVAFDYLCGNPLSQIVARSRARLQNRYAGRVVLIHPAPLYDRPVGHDAVLGNDDDPLADVVPLAVFFLEALLVDQANAAPDARVLVDDRVLDDRLGADAQRRDAARHAGVDLRQRLVVVRADEQRVLDAGSAADAAADADDRALDLRAVHDAALADEGALDVTALDLRRRQEARVRVDGVGRVVEIKRRDRVAQGEVRLEVRADRADVLPVAAVDVRLHAHARHRVRDDVPAEVDELWVRQRLLQHLALEDVDAHRREVALLAAGQRRHQAGQAARGRLLVEVNDAARVVHLEDAEGGGLILGHRNHGDGRVGAALPVRLHHLPVVHVVELVAREDQHVARARAPHVPQALADGVGRALEPVAALFGLLGCEHADEARREDVELVRRADVLVQALRVELRQHEDVPEVRVQAVRDRDVDQPILSADGNGRLRTLQSERKEARAAPATEDDREDVFHGWAQCPTDRRPSPKTRRTFRAAPTGRASC
jgi:hypothetical protein